MSASMVSPALEVATFTLLPFVSTPIVAQARSGLILTEPEPTTVIVRGSAGMLASARGSTLLAWAKASGSHPWVRATPPPRTVIRAPINIPVNESRFLFMLRSSLL